MCMGGSKSKTPPVQQPNTTYAAMPHDPGMPTVRLQDRAGNSDNPDDVMGKDLGMAQNPKPAGAQLTKEY